MDGTDHASQIRALVEGQRFAVLSTNEDDGPPYASLVAFRTSTDLKRIVFCTLRSTRKFANIEADGRISLLIDDRSNDELDLQKASALTVLGACSETHDEKRRELSQWFLDRHPAMADFVRSPGCAVMEVDVRSYFLVTRFQNVIELQVQKEERAKSE